MTRTEFRKLVRRTAKPIAAQAGKGRDAAVRVSRRLMEMWDMADEARRAELEVIALRIQDRLVEEGA